MFCLVSTVASSVSEYKANYSHTHHPPSPRLPIIKVQYYDMPHKEGTRVETPATLGRKCWAFAYLAQVWPDLKPQLQEVVGKGAGLDLTPLYDAYDYSVPLTMPLCNAQMANCFLNTTYMPEVHNGTCESSIEVRACVLCVALYRKQRPKSVLYQREVSISTSGDRLISCLQLLTHHSNHASNTFLPRRSSILGTSGRMATTPSSPAWTE